MLRARAVAALVLPFGFVTGHLVGCALAHAPEQHHDMSAQLAHHGAFHSLSGVALPLLLLSVALSVVMGIRRQRFPVAAPGLAAALAGAHLALELFDHLGNGMSLGAALTDPVLWVGVAVQLVLSVGWAHLLRGAHAVGARLHAAARPAVQVGRAAPWGPHDQHALAIFVPTRISARGPPALAGLR